MKDKLNIGDEVEAVVTNVDGAGQKLALSTKQLTNEEK
jgi:ribosomal protein S1